MVVQCQKSWSSSSLSSLQSGEGDFLRVHRQIHLAAGGAWVPPSSAAAPAAGGWGKPAPRLVHRLGLGVCPTDGAWKAEERLVWCLLSARCPFDGGALRRTAASRATCGSPGIGGSAWLPPPRPDLVAADPDVFILEVSVVDLRGGAGGCGSVLFGGDAGDFPSAWWWAPTIHGVGSLGSGASDAASSSSSSLSLSGPCCFFIFVLGLSVRVRI